MLPFDNIAHVSTHRQVENPGVVDVQLTLMNRSSRERFSEASVIISYFMYIYIFSINIGSFSSHNIILRISILLLTNQIIMAHKGQETRNKRSAVCHSALQWLEPEGWGWMAWRQSLALNHGLCIISLNCMHGLSSEALGDCLWVQA